MKNVSINKITVQILKDNRDNGNEMILLAEGRNEMERIARLSNPEISYTLDEAKDAFYQAEKLLKKEQESLAIERGSRNKKLAFRIAEPEDKELLRQSLDIRLTLSKSNGKNMMDFEIIGKGNEVLTEKAEFKNLLQGVFQRAKLIE